MGKWISNFNTTTDFAAFSATTAYSEPHVTLIKDGTGVQFIPYDRWHNGHEYVDLGLTSRTKWSTMNVGASSKTDYGNYYQYGKGASQYAATSGQPYYNGTENPLAARVDTATVRWGGDWHMPTSAQCQELIDQCTWTWTTINGVNGYSVSNNGRSIFLPASGYYLSGNLSQTGIRGVYLTSSPNGAVNMYILLYNSSSIIVMGEENRNRMGLSIRPVIG